MTTETYLLYCNEKEVVTNSKILFYLFYRYLVNNVDSGEIQDGP